MGEEPATPLVYLVMFHLSDGSVAEETVTTRRRRAAGEIFNLPVAADGTGRSGKGFLWRIHAIEDNDDPLIESTLVLEFERPHPEQE